MAKRKKKSYKIELNTKTLLEILKNDRSLRGLILLVDMFAEEMKKKLINKCLDGWQNYGDLNTKDIEKMIREHLGKDDPVDVANLAAFDWGNHSQEYQEIAGDIK